MLDAGTVAEAHHGCFLSEARCFSPICNCQGMLELTLLCDYGSRRQAGLHVVADWDKIFYTGDCVTFGTDLFERIFNQEFAELILSLVKFDAALGGLPIDVCRFFGNQVSLRNSQIRILATVFRSFVNIQAHNSS